jgi:DNA-binding NtrC family response regulator
VHQLEDHQPHADPEAAEAGQQPDGQHAVPAARCVLLAEDDGPLRVLLASHLHRHGYEVLLAEDGLQLIQQIELCFHYPDTAPLVVLVSDVRMPGIDGLRVLSSLGEHGYGLPVILITAFGTAELHAEAERRGAVAMLDKPFEIEELLNLVDGVASGALGPGHPPR